MLSPLLCGSIPLVPAHSIPATQATIMTIRFDRIFLSKKEKKNMEMCAFVTECDYHCMFEKAIDLSRGLHAFHSKGRLSN